MLAPGSGPLSARALSIYLLLQAQELRAEADRLADHQHRAGAELATVISAVRVALLHQANTCLMLFAHFRED